MPTILPEHLRIYKDSTDEDALLKRLMLKSEDFVEFLEYALDDETWVGKFRRFVKTAIQHFTDKHLHESLGFQNSERIVKKMQKHYHFLETLIPMNFQIVVEDHTIPVNSMIYGVVSTYFYQRMIEGKSKVLQIPNVTFERFNDIHEYITTDDMKYIWREEFEELLDTLDLSKLWGIDSLSLKTQKLLEIYLTKENAVELIVKSNQESWGHLRNKAMDYVNQMQDEAEFPPSDSGEFHFVFHQFTERSLALFDKVKSEITHLHYRGSLTDNELFTKTMGECSKLRALSLSLTDSFTPRLNELPSKIKFLDLSRCIWLTDDHLKNLFHACSNIDQLSLAYDVQIGANGWVLLKDLSKLNELDLSYCVQIDDSQLKIILRSCPRITKLNLEGCTGISNALFFDFYSYAPQMRELNVNKTNIDEESRSQMLMRYEGLKF